MIVIPGKIPIRIHPLFWMIIFLIGWLSTETFSLTVLWAFIIFFSVLIHECGHAFTAILFGQKAQIDLVAMGGVTQRTGPKLNLLQEFLVVLNGPLAGLLLYFLASKVNQHVALQSYPLVAYGLKVTIEINWIWTLFNLIPVQPMDGGRLFAIIMESFFGIRGVSFALFVSMVLAGTLAAICFYFNFLFGGALLFMFMFESYRDWRTSLLVTKHDKNSDLQTLFKEAQLLAQQKSYEEALRKFAEIRETTGAGVLYMAATQSIAEILAEQQKYHEAIDVLLPKEKMLSSDALLLLHHLLYKTGDFKRAIEVGKKVYQLKPNYHTALINAFSHARLGEVKPAIGWLQCAIREGLPDVQEVTRREEFDPIRNDPQFRALG